MKPRLLIRAVRLGLLDGWQQPDDLTSGWTHENPSVSETYDRAVNIGQTARLFARAVTTLGARGTT